MKPLKLTLKSIGSHRHTTIDFTDLKSNPLVVLGANGSGKTTLIEAIPLCLFGISPSIDGGKIADAISEGEPDSAWIEFAFEHNGKKYLTTRTVAASSRKQTATLVCDGNPIAGPSVREFNAEIERLFGSAQVACATWFCGQGGAGDLTNMPVADRRTFFSKILQLGRLDRMSEEAKKRRDQEKTLYDQSYVDEETRQSMEDRVSDLGAEVCAANNRVEAAKVEHTSLLGRKESLVSELQEHKKGAALAGELRKAKNTLESLRSSVPELEGVKAELVKAEAEFDKYQEALERWARIRGELAEHEKVASKRESYSLFASRAKELEERKQKGREYMDSLMQELSELPPVQETDKLWAQLREEREQAEAHNDAANRALHQREAASKEYDRLGAHLVKLESRLSNMQEPPFGDKCGGCAYLGERSAIEQEIEQTKARILETEGIVGPEAPVVGLVCMEQFRKREEDLRDTDKAVAEYNSKTSKFQQASDRLAEIGKDLANTKGYLSEYKLGEIEEAEAKIEALTKELGGWAPAPAAQSRLSEKIDRLNAQLQSFPDRMADIQVAEAAVRKCEADHLDWEMTEKPKATETEIDNSLRDVAARLHEIDIDRLTSEAGAAAGQLKEAKKHLAEMYERVARADKLMEKVEAYDFLRVFYSNRGVQQLILDSEMPRLEGIVNELFAQTETFQRELVVITQTTNQDGSKRETLDFMIRTPTGMREISRHSGGEKRMIMSIVRLGIMLWLMDMHSLNMDLLFVDEGFDALDEENAEALTSVFTKTAEALGNLVLVTHSNTLASMMPGGIEVSKGVLGSEVKAL